MAADPLVPRPYRVESIVQEVPKTVTLALSPQDGAVVPFRPGQFSMLYRFGVGEVPISISGDPTGDGPLLHTIRDAGSVTGPLTRVKVGDVLGLRGPYGSHWPVEGARGHDVLFVAGGLGMAPLRPALHAVLADRDAYGSVVLQVGARTPEDMLYPDDLTAWGERTDLDVGLTVDAAGACWDGHVGVVTTLLPDATVDTETVRVFVCGPEIMMRFVVRDLLAMGVGAERIWVSLERNMKCAVGFCGHCQYGSEFVCKDGPVFRYDRIAHWFGGREI